MREEIEARQRKTIKVVYAIAIFSWFVGMATIPFNQVNTFTVLNQVLIGIILVVILRREIM